MYSEPGQGTTFKIYLPRIEETNEAAKPEEASAPPPSGLETVLVVEDEMSVRRLAREFLEGCGYDVLEAFGGDEALRVAEQHKGPVHLLLTDVVMPGMSGNELAGISVLPAPDGTFIHPIAADRTKTSIVAQSFSFKGLHLSPRRRATDWNPCFSGISQTPLHTCAPCHRRAGFVALQAARQPAGTGSAQILRSMSPNSRRVRCPSASRSQ